jgi:cyanophycinase-like exopeptidase
MKFFFSFLAIIFITNFGLAQNLPGSLLLVGGGSENYNSWSDEPYQWAVDQSENKRVAIITYESSPSAWLPDYFESLGAVQAKNIVIPNGSVADLQETYDSLVTYDVIFFKGGNQKNYYDYYKNTLTAQAVQVVFNNGGVIGGTSAGEMILSGILFTAQNGTVYPEETIGNPNNQYMTLKDDFLQLMPGYIFDSHVVERGRFARVIGFMGHWTLNHNEDIIGIGVDDKTAFCIDKDMIGYAFGTGAVGIYRSAPDNVFSQGGTKLLASGLEITQLIHQTSINLNNFEEISGFEITFEPASTEEVFPGYILMSGSDNLADNGEFIEHFANATNSDSILIITGNNTSLAENIRSQLEQNQSPAEIMQAIPSNSGSEYLLGKVERLSKILFVKNDYSTLMDFIYSGTVGPALLENLQSGEKIVGFIGGNSRFAGGKILINYDQSFASYDGLLQFGPGLGLLNSMIIMPNTWKNDDIIENAAAGVPFGMLLEELKYGVWLNGDSFAEYKVKENNQSVITSYGVYPMLFATIGSTKAGFSPMSAVNSGLPRHVAGFELMSMKLIDESMEEVLGFVSNINVNAIFSPIEIFPNPANDFISISAEEGKQYLISILSGEGKLIFRGNVSNEKQISTGNFKPGVYFVEIKDSGDKMVITRKLIVK